MAMDFNKNTSLYSNMPQKVSCLLYDTASYTQHTVLLLVTL